MFIMKVVYIFRPTTEPKALRDQSLFKLEGGGGGEIVFYSKFFPDPH